MSKSETVAGRIVSESKPSEDYVSGELVVRHAAIVRVAHWWVALFFILAFISGAALFSPRFYFLSNLFGGGYPARQLHPWFSIFFTLGIILLFVRWAGQMTWTASDSRWMKDFKRYVRYEEIADVGKFNAGQKLFFWAVSLGGLVLLLTGIVIWFPTSFPLWLRYLSYPLHEILFILFALAIIYHVYISLFALGGTLRAMTRGTVTKAWAKGHHPRWFDEASRK
jgi:formate dehydrogenase subunit gamma